MHKEGRRRSPHHALNFGRGTPAGGPKFSCGLLLRHGRRDGFGKPYQCSRTIETPSCSCSQRPCGVSATKNKSLLHSSAGTDRVIVVPSSHSKDGSPGDPLTGGPTSQSQIIWPVMLFIPTKRTETTMPGGLFKPQLATTWRLLLPQFRVPFFFPTSSHHHCWPSERKRRDRQRQQHTRSSSA
jgi:hypothetical protein